MRVLHLSHRAPDRDALGGVEIHIADLADHLGDGIESIGAHFRGRRLVVESFRPARRELGSIPRQDLAGAITTALIELGVDVLHLHSPQIGPDAVADAAVATGVPLVLTLHDRAVSHPDAARLVRASDVVISPSQFIHDLTSTVHPEIAKKTHFIAWGVVFQAQRKRPPRTGKLRIGVVGVLSVEKGAARLPYLMHACSHLPIEWHLFGATEGRSLAAIRAAGAVRAHGAYRRRELGRLLAENAIDAALLPSIVPEAFSMTLSECISAGIPVVASELGALRERVEAEACGWLFDPWRPDSLACVLEPLVDRSRLVAIAVDAETLPTPGMMANRHESIYRELAISERELVAPPSLGLEPPTPHAIQTLRRAYAALRRTHFYRELSLRRALPERLRARIEQRTTAILDRWAR